MATSINTHAAWTQVAATDKKATLWNRFIDFVSGQQQNHTLWFFIILMVNGVLVLPVPAVLIYYFNAPVWVLGVTMLSFFANLIVNMGGESAKTTLIFFFGSLAIHLVMILAFII